MDNSVKEQIFNLIDKSQRILLLTHAKADCDGLGSMISMYLALQALGKEVTAATNDPAPEALSFLPSINIVQNSVSSSNFIITLDIRNTPLNKIKYKLADDHTKVNIIVTPRNGRFSPEDVSMGQEEHHFDLIITFDTGNLEHLGPLYDQNAEMFYNTPLINIDHHASNTDYGQVNFVDVVSASTTEMMLELLREMETRYQKTFLSPDVATLLLAGLITDTGSFQHANTSPRAMEVAAQLLDLGARQQEIIKNIYKTKKLTTLKLWGTVLSKVETDPIYRLVWSSISKNDLAETGASSEESEGIIDDLLSNAPGAEVIMLFKYNEEGYVSVSMRSTTNSVDVGKICADMGGGGHVRAAGLKRRDGTSLEKLIDETLTKVREYQAMRLNIHPEMVTATAPVEALKMTQKEGEVQNAAPTEPRREPNVQYLDFKAASEPPKSQEAPQAPAMEEKELKQAVKEEISTASQAQKPKEAPKGEKKPEKPHSQAKKDNKKSRGEKKTVETLTRDFVSKTDQTAVPVPVKTIAKEAPQATPPVSEVISVAPNPGPTPIEPTVILAPPATATVPVPEAQNITPEASTPTQAPATEAPVSGEQSIPPAQIPTPTDLPPIAPPPNPIPPMNHVQIAEDNHDQEIPPAG